MKKNIFPLLGVAMVVMVILPGIIDAEEKVNIRNGNGFHSGPSLLASTWLKMDPTRHPEGRFGHAMAYDSESDRVILFGGNNGNYLSDTWAYDFNTNTWTDMNPKTHPSARAGHAMAYDSESDRIILFGGYDGSYLFDTWAYDFNTNTWTNMNPKGSVPSFATDYAMAYDSESDRVILFGGEERRYPYYYFYTWAYDFNTNTWASRSMDFAGYTRRWHAMAYDSKNDRVILFGGYNMTYDYILADTWAYDFNTYTWSAQNPGTKPSGRFAHAMTYDLRNDEKVILFGGRDRWNIFSDTWAYDFKNNLWTRTSPPTSPEGRFAHAMAYDSESDRVILFGGSDENHFFSDTWAYENTDLSPPYVVSTIPQEGAKDVSLDTKIVFKWSEEMNRNSAEGAFSATPAITCRWSWNERDQICTPASRLEANTEYTITIDTSATDLAGNRMKNRFTLNFTSAPPNPKVIDTSPKNGTMNVPVNTEIVITFDLEMDRSATEQAISSNPSINGTFTWNNASTVVTWRPNSDLAPNRKYTITVSTGAKSSAGKPLLHAYVFDFITPPPPRVLDTSPADGATGVLVNTKIIITFSKAMEKRATENAITISPSISWSASWSYGNMVLTLTPSTHLTTRTTYTITISTAAESIDGANLVSEYKFSFTTQEESPMWAQALPWVFLMLVVIFVIIILLMTKKK